MTFPIYIAFTGNYTGSAMQGRFDTVEAFEGAFENRNLAMAYLASLIPNGAVCDFVTAAQPAS